MTLFAKLGHFLYFCVIMTVQQQGIARNKLLRYQKIVDCYLEHKTPDICTTVIWRKYIYPTFHISRTTLYKALNTPIKRELDKLSMIQLQQPELFD